MPRYDALAITPTSTDTSDAIPAQAAPGGTATAETAARPSRIREWAVRAAASGQAVPEFLEEDTLVRASSLELEWRNVVAPA